MQLHLDRHDVANIPLVQGPSYPHECVPERLGCAVTVATCATTAVCSSVPLTCVDGGLSQADPYEVLCTQHRDEAGQHNASEAASPSAYNGADSSHLPRCWTASLFCNPTDVGLQGASRARFLAKRKNMRPQRGTRR